MRKTFAPVAALLISVSILLTGQGLQGTLLPVRATLESFPTLAIGAMGAAYFVGFTLGCLRGGELVRRVGHVRVFLAMGALASASPLLHALIVQPFIWSLLRLLTGFCLAVLYVVIESWLNHSATNKTRGIVFSTYAMITLTVLGLGQMLTLLFDPADFQLFIIASVLLSIGAVPIAVALANDRVEVHEYVTVSSGLLLMYGLGAIVGPFVASTMMTLRSVGDLFLYAAICHALLAILVVERGWRHEPGTTDHSMAFADALAATQTSSHVYEEEIVQEVQEEAERADYSPSAAS